MTLTFSLCIPTMDRYDNFLSKYLPKYLENPLISEIIITDENGNDAMHIWSNFDNPKLKVYINDQRLGPLLNKIKALSFASKEWIALIDSDNFAPEEYFQTATQFISENNPSKNSIIAPSKSLPGDNSLDYTNHKGFNFTQFSNKIINLNFLRNFGIHNIIHGSNILTLLNQGNYIINRWLTSQLSISDEDPALIANCHSFDVIYYNSLLLQKLDANIYVLPNLYYNHSIHEGSISLKTREECKYWSNKFHDEFYELCNMPAGSKN